MPELIVIYGAPLTGKSSVARAVAERLDGKAAVVSVDSMLQDWIRVHDQDAYAELEMVYTQARLLVANYLKNRYHVVLEGAFLHEQDGILQQRESEIDQTTGLMRNIASPPLLVRLTASPASLSARAQALGRVVDVDGVARLDSSYRQRYGSRSLVIATDEQDVETVAAGVLERLKDG